MARTKWMRLIVRDLGDVLRWAEAHKAGQIDAFRYRRIRGNECVSFRLVPRYPIEIGTREVVVVAIARGSALRALARRTRALYRRTTAMLAVSPPPSAAAMASPSRPARLQRRPRPR